MAAYYLDTSAFVKLFVEEEGTDQMLKLLSGTDNSFVLLSLARVEFRSALRRRQRDGDISEDALREVDSQLPRILATRFIFQPVNDQVLEYAIALIDDYPLRAYDAVQLAGCQSMARSVPNPIFVCADRALLDAAQEEGFDVLDPGKP